MRILIIDNYDSFVYNLVHYLKENGCEADVVRNDKIEFKKIKTYDKLLLSPGPGIPSEAGKMNLIIKKFSGKIPILGVCLGHQAIAEVFGAKLVNLKKVFHGVACNLNIIDRSEYIYRDLPAKFKVGRYHSWIVDEKIPETLVVTAVDDNGKVMSVKHKEFDVRGVQFHPESVLTEFGKKIMKNWACH